MLQELIFLSLLRDSTSSPLSHHPLLLLPSGGSVPSVQRGCPPPPVTPPFPLERGSVRATWIDSPSRILPRDVSVPACATWAGTSSRPSPSSFFHQPRRNRRTIHPVRGGKRPPFANRAATRRRLASRGEPITAKARHPLPLRLRYSSARIGPIVFLRA
jgi:hypothetical protein